MTPFRLGLTGSIGMGKSTTAQIFVEKGIPVWDADQAVHEAYAEGGAAVQPIAGIFPTAAKNNAIDRTELRRIIMTDPAALARIEAVVHPIIAADRARFVSQSSAPLVVLDIPLLFEKGYEKDVDATLLVTAPPEIQSARVLARSGMTAELFAEILSRQMPDPEKRMRATHVVETLSLPLVGCYVTALIEHIISRQNHA